MIIPYCVDVPNEHRPWGNYLLIVSILAVFAWQLTLISGTSDQEQIKQTFDPLICNGWAMPGLITHIWMHGGIFHVVGNLIFLWVFGNAVSGKMNNLIYLPAYLFCGLIAAFTHNLFSGTPMLGASGAINGVVGMYLVMFPFNDISCFYILYFRPGSFTLSSYWMILLWFVFDIFGASMGGGGVAYFAHIGGFLSGVTIASSLLKYRLVVMNEKYEQSIFDYFRKSNKDIKTNQSFDYYDYEQKRHETLQAQETKQQLDKPKKQIKTNVNLSEDDFFGAVAEEFIRFRCNCGQKIKVATKYANRMGKCPKCGVRVKIPAA